MLLIIETYDAGHDRNGNPKRVDVVRDDDGEIQIVNDQGYGGRLRRADAAAWLGVEITQWADFGEVKIKSGEYRYFRRRGKERNCLR